MSVLINVDISDVKRIAKGKAAARVEIETENGKDITPPDFEHNRWPLGCYIENFDPFEPVDRIVRYLSVLFFDVRLEEVSEADPHITRQVYRAEVRARYKEVLS